MSDVPIFTLSASVTTSSTISNCIPQTVSKFLGRVSRIQCTVKARATARLERFLNLAFSLVALELTKKDRFSHDHHLHRGSDG